MLQSAIAILGCYTYPHKPCIPLAVMILLFPSHTELMPPPLPVPSLFTFHVQHVSKASHQYVGAARISWFEHVGMVVGVWVYLRVVV